MIKAGQLVRILRGRRRGWIARVLADEVDGRVLVAVPHGPCEGEPEQFYVDVKDVGVI